MGARATTGGRHAWMDALRGIAIILVVLGHAYAIGMDTTLQKSPALERVIEAFQPLRIPALVFLSGLLVPASLAKGARRYLRGKVDRIAYPYIVWSGIMLLVLYAASVLIGRAFDSSYALQVFYRPIEHVWFLAYLFIYYVLALALQRAHPLAVAASCLIIASLPAAQDGRGFWFLAGFFFLGVAATTYPWLISGKTAYPVAGMVALVCLVILFGALPTEFTGSPYAAATAPVALIAILGAIGILKTVSGSRVLWVVRCLGEHSIVYYLMHWPVILVFDELVSKVVPMDVLALTTVSVVVAIGSSALLTAGMSRWPWLWILFRLPAKRNLRASRAPILGP